MGEWNGMERNEMGWRVDQPTETGLVANWCNKKGEGEDRSGSESRQRPLSPQRGVGPPNDLVDEPLRECSAQHNFCAPDKHHGP
eukprot:CAMPEP_0206485768 /NCGR_PEP_ID=MMETSP0324_2-20121206/40689_1 /ASSEMBLY_ACC=CAM_ASM_000836 /TAXON_ID=2866 /ORGANISM="Crypthecodinium cohnii, Strain Seligo" /LENGTH=83 /DNA_ID=CAMNT_0053964015 /DNA_START=297 /DNA_END=545 /DNA_ORIENTATION=-